MTQVETNGLMIGDKRRIAYWHSDQTPKSVVGCIVTVVGFTRRGRVLVDYYEDGKKPFSVKPDNLQKLR